MRTDVEAIMRDLRELRIRYITDEAGAKTDVVLPIDEFQELLEDLEDLAVVAERQQEPTISHQALVDELKRDGLVQD